MWAGSLAIADGQLIFLSWFCRYVWVDILTSLPPRVIQSFGKNESTRLLSFHYVERCEKVQQGKRE